MFSTLRTRFGIPGVISVIALVFALVGGAFAANNLGGSDNGATASAKKSAKGPRGPRGPKGATGAAGPAGPAGPAGVKGDAGATGADGAAGAKGATGANGTNGTSVASVPEAPGPNCTNGGVKFTSASGNSFACNGANGAAGAPGTPGEDGEPWTAGGTLPSGATQTGGWALGDASPVIELAGGAVKINMTSISFPIPLQNPLGAADVFYIGVTETVPSECDDGVAPAASASNPEADSGKLCVFTSPGLGGSVDDPDIVQIFHGEFTSLGTDVSGAFLGKEEAESAFVFGTFAVTG